MTADLNDPASRAQKTSTYRVIAVAAVLLVTVATLVYTLVEGWSLVDSLYFSVITVATVGYGDLVPTTTVTKLFTVAYVIAGVSLVGLVLHERLNRQHAHVINALERASRALAHAERVASERHRAQGAERESDGQARGDHESE